MAFGAFGGRHDIMALFDPRRPDALGHAGTFNNNILTMAAGLVGMTQVFTPDRCRDLNQRGDALRDALNALFGGRGAPLRMSGLGSVMSLHAVGEPGVAAKMKDLVFFDLIARGFYLARRGLIALSLPVTDADTNAFVAAMNDLLTARRGVLTHD
jgi:glutamate-1-semialdehyde 2,1-aminomutase